MNLSDLDLSKLDFNNIGAWPAAAKGFFCVIVIALFATGGYFLFVKDQMESLDTAKRLEEDRKAEFERKQEKAANLENYRNQLADIQLILDQTMQVLPPRAEMPSLLVNISQTALSANMEIELFEPLSDIPRDFYVEKPISIRMTGTYHQFGAFVTAIAQLPRIVLIRDDMALQPDTRAGVGAGQLVIEGTVRTYRYLDADEAAQ